MITCRDIDLVEYSKCGLLDISAPEKEYIAAYNTVKWVLLRKVSNKLINKEVIINKYEEEYLSLFDPVVKNAEYWAGIKLGRRFISKLYWLLTKYDVIQPVQSYTLLIPPIGKIIGEYAVIQKSSKSEEPLILMLDYNRPLYYNYPNILDCVRSANGNKDYKNPGVYHFAMFRGDDWKHKNLDQMLILKWIRGILITRDGMNNYISPGSHCSECLSKRCLKAISNVR